MDTRVIIRFSHELDYICIDGNEMNVSAIKGKDISHWFISSYGWKGLIEEIKGNVSNKDAKIKFAFIGSAENKQIFEEEITKYGFGNKMDRMFPDNIANANMSKATKMQYRGFYKRAFDCYLMAYKHGKVEAAFEIALMYEVGEGVERNEERAVEWYLEAAKLGHKEAQNELGDRYWCGNGIVKNVQEAAYWYAKAAGNGNIYAQCNLAHIYKSGELGTPDYKKAYDLYALAAEQEDSSYAMYLVGQCHEYGIGVKKNVKTAFWWYEKAANSKNADADSCYKTAELYYDLYFYNLYLGESLEYGKRFTEEQRSAICWYSSMYKFLNTDKGKDMIKYYRKAAERGHTKAKEKLEKLDRLDKIVCNSSC